MTSRPYRSLSRQLYLASRRAGDIDALLNGGLWAFARRLIRRREYRAFYRAVESNRRRAR